MRDLLYYFLGVAAGMIGGALLVTFFSRGACFLAS